VERHQHALADVSGSVLGLCAKASLDGVNVVAIDGSKVSAKSVPRGHRGLRAPRAQGVILLGTGSAGTTAGLARDTSEPQPTAGTGEHVPRSKQVMRRWAQ
jgi:hypothetical protein